MEGEGRLIVALDFDGTLLTHEFPDLGEDIGAFEWLLRFQNNFPELKYLLWTVRSGEPLLGAMRYCAYRGLEFWAVNVNLDQHTWPYPGSCKAYAHAYVDDAAVGTPLTYMKPSFRPHVDWERMGPMLEQRILDYHIATHTGEAR